MSLFQSHLPNSNLDENWIHLMIAARDSGLSAEEVRQFFRECKNEDKSEEHS
jgi:DNA-binding transcriptional MerR regulator